MVGAVKSVLLTPPQKKKKKVPEPYMPFMVSEVFFCADDESEVRFAPSPFNFFLNSKTYLSVFNFYQAQISYKNSEKIHRNAFSYTVKWFTVYHE